MSDMVLEIKNLKKTFVTQARSNVAVNDVSLQLHPGESLGLVGESGCGKSTLAKLITGLIPVDSGTVDLLGEAIIPGRKSRFRKAYKNMQMVFQDPITSFDPRLPIGKSIGDVVRHHHKTNREETAKRTMELLNEVGLNSTYAKALPTAISGGECQRAAIARAIAVEPKVLICDEATSALDVSVQAQIVTLLKEIGEKLSMSFLFISHNLALVTSFCSRIAVMYRGSIMEIATSEEIINNPLHPYTNLLLSSVFPVGIDNYWQLPDFDEVGEAEGHSCPFSHRCPKASQCSKDKIPELTEVAQGHYTACTCP